MRNIFILTLSVLILWSCNSGEKTEESNSPKSWKLAYNVAVNLDEDVYDVFAMNLDGSEEQNVTNYPDVAWTYLGGKDKVFFISDRDTCDRCGYLLYEMDADGENVKQITEFLLRDSWMGHRNNGTELIVNPHQQVDSVFYIIDLEGNVLQKIETGLTYASDPCFSPDGTQIVFRGAKAKSKREKGFQDELYIINQDGTGLKQLTHYPENDTTAAWYAYKSGPPRWNKAENFISYQSFQNGKYSLYAVTPDGNKQWKLTENPQSEGYHDWTSDGKWLAIDLIAKDEKQYHIGLMNWETKALEILTDTIFKYQQGPVFIEVIK